MSKPTSSIYLKLCSCFFLSLCLTAGNAQIWKKITHTADSIKQAVQSVGQAATVAVGTAVAVNNTVHTLKKTWAKDTSKNIKYHQIPDYRTKEEVVIKKKLELTYQNGQFGNVSWQPVVNFDNQVFPSFVISWNAYTGEKDRDFGSSLGFKINTTIKKLVFKWEIECTEKEYFNIDSGYVSCDDLRGDNFMPRISWSVSAIAKQQISTPINIYFRLIDPNTGNKSEVLQKVSIRSINDCISGYDGISYKKLYIAYANEDHPAIESIMKDAMNTKMINSIDGYGGFGEVTNEAEYDQAVKRVDLQIAAIWRVLHNRGFQYSSITSNSVDKTSGKLYSQTIRPFAMSIKTSQSNCVDGTVMIASILKRCGFHTYLVLIPGHCFLAYDIDNGNASFEEWRKRANPNGLSFVETTAMSNGTYLNADSVKKGNTKYILPNYPTLDLKKATEKDKEFFLEFVHIKRAGFLNFFDDNGKQLDHDDIEIISLDKERHFIPPLPVE